MMEINTGLPIIDTDNSTTGCCPVFDPEPWDGKIFRFEELLFAKASTRSLFYMPLNMGSVFSTVMKRIDIAKANMESGYLILSQDVSKWKADHYFRVTKDVAGLEMVKLSGDFVTKVFDGEFKKMPAYIEEFKSYISSLDYEMKEFYVFYTTCPKCAKVYQHNYMVLFGKVA